MIKNHLSHTPPLIVDKGDGLNNLTNKNTYECIKQKQTGGRDDHKNDMDVSSTFTWVNGVDPMIVVIEKSFALYEKQLLDMPIQDFPVAEIDEEYDEFVPIFKVQSGITADTNINSSPDDIKHQTMRFRDQFSGHTNDIETFVDPTRKLQDKDDVPLSEFFARPVKAFEAQWNTNGILNAEFNPWRQFLTNKRVQNRLANFKLLRCNLRMKVVVNGNGFQYGRAIVAYWPMSGYDQLSTHTSLDPIDLTQTSQLPHIFIDPTTSTGGEMLIPFFWHENYFDITRSNWGGDLGLPDAGKILFRTLNPLKHANGADDKVTISFFIWAEDVEMAIPTSVDSNTLAPQAGEEVDEANTKGMVSGPATTVAKYAGIAAGYAPVAPYAMATSKVAGAIASAAKIMGYSRPTNTQNPEPFRPTPISQLATTTTPDTALKLTVDDKQELTIDPRVSGVGAHDPLIIRDIAKREAYLTQFTWPVADGPTTLLWNARVNPCLWQEDANGAIVLPPCAIAALPFRYWNGSMKFRFQVVCSTFHKGRLEIRFDPGYVDGTTIGEYNINYMEIIDIAETQDFTIEVTNSQPFSLLRHLDPGVDSVTEGYSTTDYNGTLNGLCNGVISVRVLNELTVPNSTIDNDISINVFVSAGDDFEVFVPEDNFQKFTFFQPQSGTEMVPESQNTSEPSAPQQAESDHMGADLQYSSELNMVFAGESIVSFRPLLKRYNLWRREVNNPLGTTGFRKIVRQRLMYPFYRQGSPSDYVDAGPVGYNFANTVLLHWVTTCFAGYRGSIRYKYLINKATAGGTEYGSCCDNNGFRVYVERLDPLAQSNPAYITFNSDMALSPPWLVSQSIIPGFSDRVPTGARGTVFASDLINPNVEFEVPYQTQFRFVPGKLARQTNANAVQSQAGTFQNLYRVSYEGNTSLEQQIDMHVAAGEDFQVYFWSGMPRIYYSDAPPQPPP